VRLGSLIREALSEALQPLRQDSPIPLRSQLPTAAAGVDPWQLTTTVSTNSASSTTSASSTGDDAAPRPADLAGLRAWLHSDAA
jgi:hypothetical protein